MITEKREESKKTKRAIGAFYSFAKSIMEKND